MGTPHLWTGTSFRTAIRNMIQDPTSAASQRWTDAELLDDYGNRAILQVVLDTETAVETSWTVPLVTATREYALPSNFLKDKVVEVVKETTDVRRLAYLERDQFEDLYSRDPTSAGEPGFYWYWARKGSDPTTYQTGSIYFHPVPTAAENTKLVRIWGYKMPDALAAADLTKTVELDGPFVEAALSYAAMLVKADDRDTALADFHKGNYREQIQKILDFRASKTKSRVGRIVPRESALLPFPERRPQFPWKRTWWG